MPDIHRRDFLKLATTGTVAVVTSPQLIIPDVGDRYENIVIDSDDDKRVVRYGDFMLSYDPCNDVRGRTVSTLDITDMEIANGQVNVPKDNKCGLDIRIVKPWYEFPLILLHIFPRNGRNVRLKADIKKVLKHRQSSDELQFCEETAYDGGVRKWTADLGGDPAISMSLHRIDDYDGDTSIDYVRLDVDVNGKKGITIDTRHPGRYMRR